MTVSKLWIIILLISGIGCLLIMGFLWKYLGIKVQEKEKKNFTDRQISYIVLPAIAGIILLIISNCICWYASKAKYFGRPITVKYLDRKQIYRIDGQVETSYHNNVAVLENAEIVYCVITVDPVPGAPPMSFVQRINDEIFSAEVEKLNGEPEE